MEEGLTEILESTVAVSRGLEALQCEHETVLEVLRDAADEDRDGEEGGEFEGDLNEYKMSTLNKSQEKIQAGINEAKLMLMLANYVNSLEGDKQKLKAQVKRLCAENNWLRKELTEHQQLLQETELQLVKAKEEKEHMDFLLTNKDSSILRGTREQSPSMDIDVREEEAEGVHVQGVHGGGISASSSVASVQEGGVEYEVPEKIKTLHHLALQYVNQGRPHVAVPLCKKAVQELESKKGRDNPDVAAMLNILAVIYREQGKLKEATKVLQDTLEIREKFFGPSHPAVASTYNNLSVLYGKTGDFMAAEPYCRKALEIRQKLLGPNHPDVAKQFTNLAILCSHLGKYDEVEYYYERALEIYQTELGPDDPIVAKTMSNMANCYLKQGKYRAAESTFKKVLSTVQTRDGPSGGTNESRTPVQAMLSAPGPGPDSPTARGKRGREEMFAERGGWHRSVPVDSPTVSSTLKNLSTVYREQGRMETAEELDELTRDEFLDRAQQDRVAELLANSETSSPERPISPTKSQQLAMANQRQVSRTSLSLNIRKFFRIRGGEGGEEGGSQDGNL